ncbi:MAG: recombinase zinc beta ribbon domain-containing protein [Chloroflexi bacterium]|nr:recombinase zinc beta ribbon domain-containing protein [Chloroflexota bacterium]
MLKCARCGCSLTGHVAKSGQFSYYCCSRRSREGAGACRQPMIPKQTLEGAVLERTRELLLDEANLHKLVKAVNDGRSRT